MSELLLKENVFSWRSEYFSHQKVPVPKAGTSPGTNYFYGQIYQFVSVWI